MRLKPVQVAAIKESAKTCFGPAAQVWLFGSRADDARRGGDIDLLVEADSMPPERATLSAARFVAKIQSRIGDQRIDVVMTPRGGPDDRPIVKVARETGVLL